jgi:anti-sigma factor RsiW
MKCEDVEMELMAYMDGRAKPADQIQVEEHLAGCATCRTRVAEFRGVWGVLDEMPGVEPSFGFDARVRARVAAEPRPRPWFGFFLEPRLAVAAVLLVAMTVWVARIPTNRSVSTPAVAVVSQQEDFNAIKDLGVLENLDVLTTFDSLSADTANATPRQQKPVPEEPTSND